MIANISAPLMMRAFSETAFHRSRIQGSYCEEYGRHEVSDLTLAAGQQRRWTQRGNKRHYDNLHGQMLEEIERLQMQIVCEWLAENSPVTNRDI